MDTNRIKELEEKYFNEIIDLFHNKPDFKNNLLEVEEFIRTDYPNLNKNWGDKNKLKVAVERLIRFHFYTNLNVLNIYPSPLSPDMAIELEDVILCVDAKTIDMCGNPGDDDSIHFQKNQITFINEPKYGQYINNVYWPGIEFPPYLRDFYKDKPCLTFFITVNYEDDGSSFKLSHVCFCSVPHKQIVKEDFDKKIISNFKTYEYISAKETEKLTNGKYYKPFVQKKLTWDEYEIEIESEVPNKDGSYTIRSSTICHDKTISNLENSIRIRKKIDDKWKVVKCGGSARISKEKLKIRKSCVTGKTWVGVKEYRVGAGHESRFKTTGIYWNPSASNNQKGTKRGTLNRHTLIQTFEPLGP